jgi:hypothetical protein
MTARPLEADDFPHLGFQCCSRWIPHSVRDRTFLQPFNVNWSGMRQQTADTAWFYSTDIEFDWPFQLRLEAVPTWNNQVPILEQLTSAISAKPIRHQIASAFIRDMALSSSRGDSATSTKAQFQLVRAGVAPGPRETVWATQSRGRCGCHDRRNVTRQALKRVSPNSHSANKAGTRDIPGLSRASSTGRG